MKLKDFLKEEWVDSVKQDKETYEIFINPTRKDLSDIMKISGKYVRFLIELKTKKVYVWSSHLLHEFAAKGMRKPYTIEGTNDYFYGSGTIKNDKIEFEGSSYVTVKDRKKIVNKKKYTSWLSKYFSNL